MVLGSVGVEIPYVPVLQNVLSSFGRNVLSKLVPVPENTRMGFGGTPIGRVPLISTLPVCHLGPTS